MTFNQSGFSRRRFLLSGAPVISLGLEALALPNAAHAQKSDSSKAISTKPKVWSSEYWAKRGEVTLSLFRKRVGDP